MSTSNNNQSNNDHSNSAATAPKQMDSSMTVQPTDAYLPSYLLDLVPELELYQQLLDAEKKLDMYLARKKIDLCQNITQWNNQNQFRSSLNHRDAAKVKYLRIFVSNIAENQPWQDPSRDFGNASWTLRIEGRLLDDTAADEPSRPKFSSFIQDIAVDFKLKGNKTDRSGESSTAGGLESIQPGGGETITTTNDNALDAQVDQQQEQQPLAYQLSKQTTTDNDRIVTAVEWHFDPSNPVDFDGLDIKRFGTENVECTITIQLKGFTGSSLEYSPELSLVIGTSHGSLHDAIYALYKYILTNDLLVGSEFNSKMTPHGSTTTTKATAGNSNSTVHFETNTSGGSAAVNEPGSEKTLVKLDAALRTLLPSTITGENKEPPKTLKLADLPTLVNMHVSLQRPIKFDYTIRVDKASTYGEVVFDVEIPYSAGTNDNNNNNNNENINNSELSDDITAESLKLVSELDKLSNEVKTKVDTLNREAAILKLQLNLSASKYNFFNRLAKDPAPVLQEYIAASSNALKVLSGDEGFNEDTVRRSQFYKDNEDILYENLGILLTNGRI